MNIGNQIKKDLKTMADSEGYGKIIVSTLIGATLGITVTYSTGVASNRIEIVRLATQIEALRGVIITSMDDRYKGADARRDFALITERILQVRKEGTDLKERFDEHINSYESGK